MELALRSGRRDVGNLQTCAVGTSTSSDDDRRTFTEYGVVAAIVVVKGEVDVVSWSRTLSYLFARGSPFWILTSHHRNYRPARSDPPHPSWIITGIFQTVR